MKSNHKLSVFIVLLCLGRLVLGQSPEEYVKKAQAFNKAGEYVQAAKVMDEALTIYPDNSTVYAYLGLYRGMQAGQTDNFLAAGKLIRSAYEALDKAVVLDGNNLTARLNRGLMGVKVPSFLGKLDGGIADLEFIVTRYQQAPDKIPVNLAANAYNFLGEGYSKAKDNQKARAAWQKVIELVPGTPLAESAKQNLAVSSSQPAKSKPAETEKVTTVEIEQIREAIRRSPDNAQLYLQLGKAYTDLKDYEEAVKALRMSIKLDSINTDTYKLLIWAIGQIAAVGYDQRIYEDTNFRTNLAFEIVRLADEAVKVAPDDPELLLIRGRSGVMMPFFVDKLDQAIRDLDKVSKSPDASEAFKAEAIYWLGYAYQKKAMTNWINVIKNYAETEACKMAFASMLPPIEHFNPDNYAKPFVKIDFILGFRDELEPQTVVWIEDKAGKFIKTVYVSGFSAFAKEKQINLPKWSKASQFKDVDGVSGASIDLGHHIYVWDLKDAAGKPVKAGDYVVKVEVSYWPSMQYQAAKVPVTVGNKESRVVVQEGNLIPYLEATYSK